MPLAMPEKPPRTDDAGDERATLTSYLEYQRSVMVRKVAELDDDALRRSMTPSGLTLLGMMKHLAFVERYWFQEVFAGRTVDFPWTDEDPDADWRAEPGETVEEIVALYRGECDIAREITAAASFDDVVTYRGDRQITLRAIVVHMIEETARHVGHADIMREAIDGQTGD
jgi:uncharacterized damage-inducible protein DinB